jgi:hypothetical protein
MACNEEVNLYNVVPKTSIIPLPVTYFVCYGYNCREFTQYFPTQRSVQQAYYKELKYKTEAFSCTVIGRRYRPMTVSSVQQYKYLELLYTLHVTKCDDGKWLFHKWKQGFMLYRCASVHNAVLWHQPSKRTTIMYITYLFFNHWPVNDEGRKNIYQLSITENLQYLLTNQVLNWTLICLTNTGQEKLINWQAPQVQLHYHFKDTYYNHQSYMNFFMLFSRSTSCPPPPKGNSSNLLHISNTKTLNSSCPLEHNHCTLFWHP